MDLAKTKNRVKELRSLINYHNHRYHVMDSPEIGDNEYDMLMREIKQIETEHPELVTSESPTQRVGAAPVGTFGVVEHKEPLLSLGNVFSSDELFTWHNRTLNLLEKEEFDLVCEIKMDGLAVALTYINGILVTGATRGDGYHGEDVTQNLRTIRSIPLSVPKDAPPKFEVRGEVILSKTGFRKLNDDRAQKGLPLFANPRNAAAGSLRQLDCQITAQRPLDIYIYAMGWSEGKSMPSTHWETLEYLKSLGLKISPYNILCKSIQEAEEYHLTWEEKRDSLPFEADGVVIKANNLATQQRLGTSGHEPRWAIAYKFTPTQAITILKDIGVNVGRTGTLNPYAILAPVHVSGVTLQHAALHNADYIREKDIRIGDTVIVQRAGDVIPEIVGPISSKRTGKEREFQMPLTCPACKASIIKPEGEAMHRCINTACPAQSLERLKHFVSRGAMDVDGIGEKLCAALFDAGLINDVSDFYYLTRDQLLGLERLADRSVSNILDSIENSKDRSLHRVIFALGIQHVGAETAELLTRHFSSMKSLAAATEEKLVSIPSIGPQIAQSIIAFFEQPENKNIIERLGNAGLRLEEETIELKQLPLTGQEFVITGKFEGLTQQQAEEQIKTLGGLVGSSVTRKTTFLIVGADPGSKLDKARKLGVKLLTQEDFLHIIESVS